MEPVLSTRTIYILAVAKEKPPRHRVGAASKQEIEPPGSVDERPARDPEENAGGIFPATAVVFQIVSVIFRIPSRIRRQRSTTGCRRL